jgi:hypothetical protein
MSSTATTTGAKGKAANGEGLDARLTRVLDEGYGPGAWHGPDFKAALEDVTPAQAFWRPAPERHNIAEVALHHAYQVHAVRGKLSDTAPEPFPLKGEDWFAASEDAPLSWPKIRKTVEDQQQRLASLAGDIAAGRVASPLSETERFELVLGITCHAVYHAGQVQLLKRLQAG